MTIFERVFQGKRGKIVLLVGGRPSLKEQNEVLLRQKNDLFIEYRNLTDLLKQMCSKNEESMNEIENQKQQNSALKEKLARSEKRKLAPLSAAKENIM